MGAGGVFQGFGMDFMRFLTKPQTVTYYTPYRKLGAARTLLKLILQLAVPKLSNCPNPTNP